jgi:hypothetical protein
MLAESDQDRKRLTIQPCSQKVSHDMRYV